MINLRSLLIALTGLALAVLGLACQSSAALAAPAAPFDIPATQPDGTTFTARQWGDEWQHGMETADGYTILRDEASGYWVYAAVQDGSLVPALSGTRSLVVGRDRPAGLAPHARPAPDPDTAAPFAGAAYATDERLPTRNLGGQPMLFVLVNYLDRTLTYTREQFQQKAFGATGSISHYYAQASFNALTITPASETDGSNDGVVVVTIAKNHPNDTNASQTIAADTLTAANPYINYASYDSDGDGYVTSAELHLIFVIAGYEEAFTCGTCIPRIWAHSWALASPLTLDGRKVGVDSADGDPGGYAMFGEIHGTHIAQIGIMAHELGHDLTWPDLYDTDGGSQGIGNWSIMGGGSWNGLSYSGDSPALPDAFLKWYQGWLTPTSAAAGSTYPLRQASSYTDTLLLGSNPNGVDWNFYKTSGTGEYWLVENRQKSGYDAGLPGCGILIWHIDETRTSTNSANAVASRRLVDLEQADGLAELNSASSERGDAGDPYPGSSANTRFSSTTNPASTYYAGGTYTNALTVETAVCNAITFPTMNVTLLENSQPSVTVNQAAAQADPTRGGSIAFTAAFSETVTGFAASDVSFSGSTAPGTLAAAVSGTGSSYTITVSGMTGSGTLVVSIPAGAAQDSAGNLNLASTSTDNTVTYDVTPPTVTVNQAAAQADPTGSSAIKFTAAFSETVTGFAGGDISFSGSTAPGTLAAAVSGAGSSYTITVSGMTGSGTVVVSIPASAAQDSAGNNSSASTSTDHTVTYDATTPASFLIYLPSILNYQQITFSGRVTYKGVSAAGQTVTLQGINGTAYTDLAETAADAAGNYRFVTLTQPDLYPQYRVIWQNSGNSQTMWNWKCSPVSGVNAAAYTCNIEIADTALSAPASGASVSLPATFTWTRRATTGESYEVNFLDANHLYVGWSDSYPDTGQWTMASLTDLAFGALNTDVQYYWEMWVYGPTGYGIGYALRPLTFTPLGAAPALSGIPPAQPLPRSKLDALPEQPKRPQSPQNAP